MNPFTTSRASRVSSRPKPSGQPQGRSGNTVIKLEGPRLGKHPGKAPRGAGTRQALMCAADSQSAALWRNLFAVGDALRLVQTEERDGTVRSRSYVTRKLLARWSRYRDLAIATS